MFVHGARSQEDLDIYSSIISSVSNILCTGTPTADFAAIFSNVAATAAPTATGATVLSDQFPSQSAVSLYYTAVGSQGPGAISGSAMTATASAGVNTATDSSSGSGAKATQGVSFGGIAAAVGGIAIAVL